MPIDSRIALGVQPLQLPQQNPNAQMNMLAQAMQLKSGMTQLQAAEQERAERNALNEAYRSALGPNGDVDRNALFRTLADRNLGSKIPGLQEKFSAADKAKHDAFKAAGENYKTFQLELGSEFNNPNLSKQTVAQRIAMRVQAGAMDAALGERMVAMLPDDPQQLRGTLRQLVTSQMTPEQMLTVFAPKPTQVDNGQQIGFRDTNPNSPTYGQVTAGAPVQKVADPGAVLSAQTSTANNQRSVAAQYDLNKATREAAATNAAAVRDAAAIKDKRDTEMKLGDDYRAQSKPFKEVADAYKIITSSLDKATTSPAATLAGATKFMKLLDPGSVVRESELGMALAAAGVLDRAANYYNTLQRGKVLTEKQAADFKNIAAQIYKAAQDGQKQVDANYTRQAKQYDLRPDMIVQDLGQNTPVPVDLGSLPPAGAPAGKPKVVDFGSLK